MHELSIMDSALSMVLEQAKTAGAGRIYVVRLRVGALSGAVPEALQMAFEALTPGTKAEGAKLLIEEVPATFRCGVCNEDFTSEELLSECPKCGEASRDILSGRELELASLEVD